MDKAWSHDATALCMCDCRHIIYQLKVAQPDGGRRTGWPEVTAFGDKRDSGSKVGRLWFTL